MANEARHSEFLIKTAIVGLFILGQLIVVGGFFIEYADDVPLVYRWIAPKYFHANQGLQNLVKDGSLNAQTTGFHDIADILLKDLKKTIVRDGRVKDPAIITNLNIYYVKMHEDLILFKGKPIPEYSLLDIITDNPKLLNYSNPDGGNLSTIVFANAYYFQDLQNEVNGIKRSEVFVWALILVILGTTIEFVAFIIDFKENFSQRPTIAEEISSTTDVCDI
jgi:hypothetical protein